MPQGETVVAARLLLRVQLPLALVADGALAAEPGTHLVVGQGARLVHVHHAAVAFHPMDAVQGIELVAYAALVGQHFALEEGTGGEEGVVVQLWWSGCGRYGFGVLCGGGRRGGLWSLL